MLHFKMWNSNLTLKGQFLIMSQWGKYTKLNFPKVTSLNIEFFSFENKIFRSLKYCNVKICWLFLLSQKDPFSIFDRCAGQIGICDIGCWLDIVVVVKTVVGHLLLLGLQFGLFDQMELRRELFLELEQSILFEKKKMKF